MEQMPATYNLAILLFDDVEVLDFAGPYEVFSVSIRHTDPPAFHVFTVAEETVVTACNGLSVNPHYSLSILLEFSLNDGHTYFQVPWIERVDGLVQRQATHFDFFDDVGAHALLSEQSQVVVSHEGKLFVSRSGIVAHGRGANRVRADAV